MQNAGEKPGRESRDRPRRTRRWRGVCAYDGGRFHGWQSQRNAVAVQDVIEAALARILQTPVRIHGSGRTDTGVHALAQVFHFDAAWRGTPQQFVRAVATKLPAGVQVKTLRPVRRDFHAQHDARGKRYHYRIFLGNAGPFEAPWCWSWPRPLDWERIEAAAACLRGRHDFAAFSAWNGDEKATTVRELHRLDIRRRGRRVRITLEADGFLYKMARSIVGALVAVGAGKLEPEAIETLLRTGRRVPAVVTAPAQGLFLERVFYG